MKFENTLEAALILVSAFFNVSKEDSLRLVPFRDLETYQERGVIEGLTLMVGDVKRLGRDLGHDGFEMRLAHTADEYACRTTVHLADYTYGAHQHEILLQLVDNDLEGLLIREVSITRPERVDSNHPRPFWMKFSREDQRVVFEIDPMYTAYKSSERVSEALFGLLEANVLDGETIGSIRFIHSSLQAL